MRDARRGGPEVRGVPGVGPSEIAPGVFVGGARDATGFDGFRICVRDELEGSAPAEMRCPVLLPDGSGADRSHLERIALETARQRSAGRPVLIYCGQGSRRGPLAGAWYLRAAFGLSLHEAFRKIRSVRPQAEHPQEWLGNVKEILR